MQFLNMVLLFILLYIFLATFSHYSLRALCATEHIATATLQQYKFLLIHVSVHKLFIA